MLKSLHCKVTDFLWLLALVMLTRVFYFIAPNLKDLSGGLPYS
ncbi:hypothetical protein AO367_0049 [Moraxella catarrhalis]|nr:hypothetical protein AO380_0100 [Moraxella catarrhalis]OAV32455.1 hypothetical protein AO367_0049 [Moraxella catarrhalis]